MKPKPQQLTLFETPEEPIMHHHIEVHYEGGYREVVCTANPQKTTRNEYEIYAGFVGGVIGDGCHICTPKSEGREEEHPWKKL